MARYCLQMKMENTKPQGYEVGDSACVNGLDKVDARRQAGLVELR